MEDARPVFLLELWPVLAQPAPEWVPAHGLQRRPFSSYSRMKVALGLHCRMETFHRGNHMFTSRAVTC